MIGVGQIEDKVTKRRKTLLEELFSLTKQMLHELLLTLKASCAETKALEAVVMK